MANLQPALDLVLKHEGGLNDKSVSHDPGGLTNFGISLRFLRNVPFDRLRKYGIFDAVPDEDTIRNLTPEIVKNVYEGEFWIPNRVGEIHDQDVANYLFDCIINPNPTMGIKFLQRALWSVHGYECCKDDGILGSKTLAMLNDLPYVGLIRAMKAERACWYRAQNNDVYIDGWLRRTYDDPA